AEHLDKPPDVRIVERGIDLVEETERTRLVFEKPEHQRDRGECLFAAREQLDALKPFAWRLRDDFDAAFERIGLVEKRQAGASTAEQRAERFLEIPVDGGERLR